VHFPLKSNLDFKDNSLDTEVVSFIIWYFTYFFVDFANSNYNFVFK
jgi:hypothetical protein